MNPTGLGRVALKVGGDSPPPPLPRPFAILEEVAGEVALIAVHGIGHWYCRIKLTGHGKDGANVRKGPILKKYLKPPCVIR